MLDFTGKKIVITGSDGFLGSFVLDELKRSGVKEESLFLPTFPDYDLRSMDNCLKAIAGRDVVIHLAARVGDANEQKAKPAEFFYDNLLLGVQMIEAARRAKIKKIVLIGTMNSYPAIAPSPFVENSLWDGYPEAVNAPYALAKRVLAVQASAYYEQYGLQSVYLIFSNLYGPRFNIDTPRSFLVTMIKKICDAKINNYPSVELPGTGLPIREFLYASEAARAIVLALKNYSTSEPLNIGSGEAVTLRLLADLIAKLSGYSGNIIWTGGKRVWDDSVRCLDFKKAMKEIGFSPKIKLSDGLRSTIDWYISQKNKP